MNTQQPVEKKFDPTTAAPIKIAACANGWAVYDHNVAARRSHNDCMGVEYGPSYVFTSAAALGVAIANLVAHGTITKPLAPELPTIDVPQGFRLIEEFKVQDPARSTCWYQFITASGHIHYRFVWGNGACSMKNNDAEIRVESFLAVTKPIYFRELSVDEAREYVK